MKFSKIIGKIDPNLVSKAEEKLSTMFIELASKYNNQHIGSGVGGDPLIFSLLYPVEHVCTLNIPTAATDGKRNYWNPKFVLKKCGKTNIGLRIIAAHEAWHSIYMHPQRRGSRNPKLWNIAVDYIVNGMVMEDFTSRGLDAKMMFKNHLGSYMTLKEYVEFLKDPFSSPIKNSLNKKPLEEISLPNPNDDRDLTEKEKKELERREEGSSFYYADPDLEKDMKKPEKIYDLLYSLLPKCPKCGRVGVYSKNKDEDNSDKNKDGSNEEKSSDGKDKEDKDFLKLWKLQKEWQV